VAEFLEMGATSRAGKIPYVLLIDESNSLQRAVCDGKLIDAALRCRERWHSLQELGGINNSHALYALAEAQAAWEIEKQALLEQASTSPVTNVAPVASPPEVVAEVPETTAALEPVIEESTETSSDNPWIETIRCTTCNECTELNNRMFAYDADQRAYIKDPDAGTYREMVEAAETCQVAIIHPGKPRNPDESNLEELMERAEPFND
jgi:ferredoxin